MNSIENYENTCPVCLEIMHSEVNGAITNCGHRFHLGCLMKCFIINNSCPLCRQMIHNENEQQPEEYSEPLSQLNDTTTDLDETNNDDDFEFPEIPEVRIINGRRLFVKNGYLYLNIECYDSEKVAIIHTNYDDEDSVYYEWLNTSNVLTPYRVFYDTNANVALNINTHFEEGEILEQNTQELVDNSTELIIEHDAQTDDDLLMIDEILFTPIRYVRST
jgi:hypothetical protein